MTLTTKEKLLPLSVVQELVALERMSQDQKWGVQTHTPLKWMAILMEEVGEYANAYLEHGVGPGGNGLDHIEIDEHMIEEMVQVAAVAVAAIQDLSAQLNRSQVDARASV